MSGPYEPPQSFSSEQPSHFPPQSNRPQTAIVFGILNILYGIWTLCGVIANGAGLAFILSSQEKLPGAEMYESSWGVAFGISTMGLNFILAIVLMIAGVGLMRYLEWGRRLSVIYAVSTLFLSVIGFAIMFFFVLLPSLQGMDSLQGPQRAGAIGGLVGGLIGGVIAFIYPVVLLIFMTRPSMKRALENAP